MNTDMPRIISVDDHVVEPPDLWMARLPSKYRDRGPRVVRTRISISGKPAGGGFDWAPDENGDWSDVWHYDDLASPLLLLSAAVGFDEVGFKATTFDEIRKGAWDQASRLADMTANHVDAALNFPNTLPRFCGQAFLERDDKELAYLCVRAYNDWMIDEWSAGAGAGRLLPVTIVPLWDAELAAAEIRRCADKGSFAITFPENPSPLGLPSIHDPRDVWAPVFRACEETESVLCMHIGSSSRMPTTSPDAPFIISSTLTFQNAMGSLLDYLFSGTLAKYPGLTIAYSEGQVGWMPYVLERADKLWEERGDNSFGSSLPRPPSSYIPGRVYGCIFDDASGLRNRDAVGMDQICFETDYPHADSTFPTSNEVLAKLCHDAELSADEIYKLARGNAIAAFRLRRFGITR
jgi:predicted TIM-barrel fold metal-dependent hydrolase